MRLLADENIDVRRVVRTHPPTDDMQVLMKANAEGRIVVTQDRDFGDRLIRKAVPAAGAFLLRTDDLARGLDAISKDRDRCRGALVIVTDAAVRVRTLPNQDDDVS